MKNRIISAFLCLIMVISILPQVSPSAQASYTQGIYTYTVAGGRAIITDCDNTSASGAIEIPSTLGGNQVTTIDNGAFSNCTAITSVVIADGITKIGDDAFSNCTALTNIVIPEGVRMGKRVFSNCYSLTSIRIPYGITTISEGMFEYCNNLKSVNFSDTVNQIGYGAFTGCTALTSFTIPDSVTVIGDYAFSACNGLTSVTMHDDITAMGDYVFAGCSSLESIEIPDKVEVIGEGAFEANWSLKNVIIGSSVTTIGNYAFVDCNKLTSVEIPNSVTTIAEGAFMWCNEIKDVYYTGTESQWDLITIESGNSYLTNATIHYKEEMTEGIFTYTVANDEAIITACDTDTEGDIVIPETLGGYPVVEIDVGAFAECSSIESIEIPKTLMSIGEDAFLYCKSLSNVYYSGSQEDWNAINIAGGNDALLDANIEYYYGTTAIVQEASCVFTGNVAYADVAFAVLECDATVLAAVYDIDGRLIGIGTVAAKTGDSSASVEVLVEEGADCDSVNVMVWSEDCSAPLCAATQADIEHIPQCVEVDTVLESEHNYASNTNESHTYIHTEKCVSIDVTFTSDTEVEKKFDFIYIYDGEGNEIGKYTGKELAGATVNIPGNKVEIKLVSDGSVNKYGFKTESIVVNNW